MTQEDIFKVMPLCLRHRLRKDPLEQIDSGEKVTLPAAAFPLLPFPPVACTDLRYACGPLPESFDMCCNNGRNESFSQHLIMFSIAPPSFRLVPQHEVCT